MVHSLAHIRLWMRDSLEDFGGLCSESAGVSKALHVHSRQPWLRTAERELVYYASSSYKGVLRSRLSSNKFYKEAQFYNFQVKL